MGKKALHNRQLDIGNVVAAFSEDQVARFTGLSKRRLRYWARTGFFNPSYSSENNGRATIGFYSFRDVVALRTLEILRVRNSVPLQHLRKVAAKLNHLHDRLWTETVLHVVKKEVYFENPETGKLESVISGQRVFDEMISLTTVINQTRADIIEFTRRKPETAGRINRSRGVVSNAWVVAGTRIPVAAIWRLHEDGYSTEQIIREYPDLAAADIAAAIRHRQEAKVA